FDRAESAVDGNLEALAVAGEHFGLCFRNAHKLDIGAGAHLAEESAGMPVHEARYGEAQGGDVGGLTKCGGNARGTRKNRAARDVHGKILQGYYGFEARISGKSTCLNGQPGAQLRIQDEEDGHVYHDGRPKCTTKGRFLRLMADCLLRDNGAWPTPNQSQEK